MRLWRAWTTGRKPVVDRIAASRTHMNLRHMVGELKNQANEVFQRLQSPEGDTLNQVDLAILRIRLQLLDEELAKRQYRSTREAS